MISSINFNTHPELSDEQFAIDLASVYNGVAPKAGQLPNWLSQIQKGGRYSLYQSWVNGGYAGNSDDNWMKIIPSWAVVAAIVVAIAAAGYMAYRAWGHLLKDASNSVDGNGGDE